MSIDQPDLERLDRPPGGVPKNKSPNENKPNTNRMTITEIRGLLSQVTEKLGKIHLETDKQTTCWRIAIDEVDLFEKTTLFELQKALE